MMGQSFKRGKLEMNVLVIDVGGTHVKILATGKPSTASSPPGPELTPVEMVAGVEKAAEGWTYEVIAMGYPGPRASAASRSWKPHNWAKGWVGFDFEAAFKHPIKIVNDAAMQALGSYRGGRMLFLGLGTGLGSALVVDGILEPLELAHLPYKKRTFEDYVGIRGLERFGKKKWAQAGGRHGCPLERGRPRPTRSCWAAVTSRS